MSTDTIEATQATIAPVSPSAIDPITGEFSLSRFINASDKQKIAFAATQTHVFVLYGGAMGGGKSYFLRMWCIRECIRLYAKYKIKGIRIGLFSKDYPTLRDRQIRCMKLEIPAYIGKVSDSMAEGLCLQLTPQFGSGVIVLRNLDQPEKYNSAEFAGIAVEELTENPESIFHELRKRLRASGIAQSDMHFVAAANPGGIGHVWVKKLWIDRDFPTELSHLAQDFSYVAAKAQDNPHLDRAYYEMLLSLPEEMRKAYAEGSWDIFAGQYFKEWRNDVHVIEPFEIPWHWKIQRSSDWGEGAPCAHLWTATSPEGKHYVIGEVYGKNMSIKDQADAIKHFEQGKNVEKYGILDSASFVAAGQYEGKSINSQFAEYGVYNIPCAKGPGSRVAGWQMIRRDLDYKKDVSGSVIGQPNIQVFSTCINLIRTIPALVYTKTGNVNDCNSASDDHACFVAGTLIATSTGPKAIEHIQIGDEVVTPLGIAKVLASNMTGKHQTITSNGLTGTGNHPVFTDHGIVRLDSLRDTDTIWQLNQSYLKELPTVDIQNQKECQTGVITNLVATQTSNPSIERYGRVLMEQFLRASIFITKMKTLVITPLITLNAYLRQSICRSTQVAGNLTSITSQELDLLLSNGIDQKRVKSGIESTLLKSSITSLLDHLSVSSAKALIQLRRLVTPDSARMIVNPSAEMLQEKITSPDHARSVIMNSLQTNILIQPVAASHAVINSGVQSVYNLSTSHGCYFANEILVSNCDALRYFYFGPVGGYLTPASELAPEEAAMRRKAINDSQLGSSSY